MKICCPTKDGRIDDHFGHCAYYTIFTVENGQITAEETMASPEGCGCKSGIAPVLAEKGVIVMLGGKRRYRIAVAVAGSNFYNVRHHSASSSRSAAVSSSIAVRYCSSLGALPCQPT